MANYNAEYFYMNPAGNQFPSLTLWGIQENIFWRAEPIEHELLPFVYTHNMVPKNPELGDAHWLGPNFVVSERLKDHLEKLNLKNIQLVPATIKDEKEKVNEGYFALHLYNAVHCADLKKSEWTPFIRNPEQVQSFDKLVLDNEALDKIPLEDRLAIMVEEETLTHIYHRSVVEHILKIKPSGLRFHSVSGSGREPFEDEFLDYILQD